MDMRLSVNDRIALLVFGITTMSVTHVSLCLLVSSCVVKEETTNMDRREDSLHSTYMNGPLQCEIALPEAHSPTPASRDVATIHLTFSGFFNA